jgi:hypothetical protein
LPSLLEGIRQLTPAERAHLMGELARAITVDLGGKKEVAMLTDHCGKPVGLFLPVNGESVAPPPMSPADRAELQRRLDNRHDAVSYEDFIRLLQPAETAETAQSK